MKLIIFYNRHDQTKYSKGKSSNSTIENKFI